MILNQQSLQESLPNSSIANSKSLLSAPPHTFCMRVFLVVSEGLEPSTP